MSAERATVQTPAQPTQLKPEAWRPSHNPWLIALTVTLATFMEVLDTSIANVALPHIAGGLAASSDEATWVLTSYLVSNGIVLPVSGWVSGFIGRKRFYMLCVALFTASSFLCGLAPTLPLLIVFRTLQGAAGGGLQPSEQSILADTFPPAKFGMAFAVYGMAVVLAPAIGPTLGGWITDNFNWRWIFFINVPVGIVSLLLSYRMLEDPPYLKRQVRANRAAFKIDYPGLGLIALGLGSLQVVLDKGQEEDWFGSHLITVLAVVTVAALVAFVIFEWRCKNPVVDLHLFRNYTFAIGNGMMFFLGVVLYGTTVLLPLFLQELMGYTAELSGMVLSPGAVVIIILLPLVGALVSRVDARWLILFGLLLSAVAMYHMTNLNLDINFETVTLWRCYQTAGLAFLFIPINTMCYVGVPREKSREVSSLINLCRNVGGSVGISMATTVIDRRSQFHQDRLIAHATVFDPAFQALLSNQTLSLFHSGLSRHEATAHTYGRLYSDIKAQAAVLSYIDTIWVFTIIFALMIPFVFLMRKSEPGSPGSMH
jgi:DHA2 family multidrug resistance protein